MKTLVLVALGTMLVLMLVALLVMTVRGELWLHRQRKLIRQQALDNGKWPERAKNIATKRPYPSRQKTRAKAAYQPIKIVTKKARAWIPRPQGKPSKT